MSYYSRHREEQLQKRLNYYHKRTGSIKRYKKGYLITFPDGKQVIKKSEAALSILWDIPTHISGL